MERMEAAKQLRGLISAYQPELLRVCYFYLRDRQLAEDAVQEAFTRIWRRLDKAHDCPCDKAWIYRIAINCCRDMQRTGWFRRMLPVGEPELFPQEGTVICDETIALNMAVHALPLRQREVILLYYYQNFTVTEIAGILRISQPSVTERLKRARKSLREALEEDIFDETEGT